MTPCKKFYNLSQWDPNRFFLYLKRKHVFEFSVSDWCEMRLTDELNTLLFCFWWSLIFPLLYQLSVSQESLTPLFGCQVSNHPRPTSCCFPGSWRVSGENLFCYNTLGFKAYARYINIHQSRSFNSWGFLDRQLLSIYSY